MHCQRFRANGVEPGSLAGRGPAEALVWYPVVDASREGGLAAGVAAAAAAVVELESRAQDMSLVCGGFDSIPGPRMGI